MRIAVVQHIRSGYYSDYLSSLIDEAATAENFQIKTWSNSIPVFNQQIPEDAIVYILIESTTNIGLKLWYAKKLSSVLKKIKASIVIDLNGISSSAKIPQIIAIDQNTGKNIKDANTIRRYAEKNIEHSIQLAQCAIVYSNNKAETLSAKNAKEIIRFTAPSNFRKFEWHEKIMTKAMQADNNEYFLSVLQDDDEENFMLVMHAFSKFKKWQQSSMKFLLLPKYEAFEKNIHEKLKTYKFKDDVRLLEAFKETELVSVIASAHSFVHVSSETPDLEVLSIALKCALPIITNRNADAAEYLGGAAFFLQNKSEEILSDALIKLYKDENLHAQLKDEAEKQSLLLNREEYKLKVWQLIKTAAQV